MIGSMASIGLTVALFVSGEAFPERSGMKRLQGESKLGALLSGLMGFACVGIAKSPLWRISHEGLHKHRSLHPTEDVKLPPRPSVAAIADQQFYKHVIRAHDGAFTVPAHKADKPGLFATDSERAQARWRVAMHSVIISSQTSKVSPIGPTKEATQRNVLAAFSNSAASCRTTDKNETSISIAQSAS